MTTPKAVYSFPGNVQAKKSANPLCGDGSFIADGDVIAGRAVKAPQVETASVVASKNVDTPKVNTQVVEATQQVITTVVVTQVVHASQKVAAPEFEGNKMTLKELSIGGANIVGGDLELSNGSAPLPLVRGTVSYLKVGHKSGAAMLAFVSAPIDVEAHGTILVLAQLNGIDGEELIIHWDANSDACVSITRPNKKEVVGCVSFTHF